MKHIWIPMFKLKSDTLSHYADTINGINQYIGGPIKQISFDKCDHPITFNPVTTIYCRPFQSFFLANIATTESSANSFLYFSYTSGQRTTLFKTPVLSLIVK